MNLLSDFFTLFFIVPIVFLVIATLCKSRWGINLKGAVCPNCKLLQAKVRKPNSVKQAMWGGWTCESCGCEADKWGRAI